MVAWFTRDQNGVLVRSVQESEAINAILRGIKNVANGTSLTKLAQAHHLARQLRDGDFAHTTEEGQGILDYILDQDNAIMMEVALIRARKREDFAHMGGGPKYVAGWLRDAEERLNAQPNAKKGAKKYQITYQSTFSRPKGLQPTLFLLPNGDQKIKELAEEVRINGIDNKEFFTKEYLASILLNIVEKATDPANNDAAIKCVAHLVDLTQTVHDDAEDIQTLLSIGNTRERVAGIAAQNGNAELLNAIIRQRFISVSLLDNNLQKSKKLEAVCAAAGANGAAILTMDVFSEALMNIIERAKTMTKGDKKHGNVIASLSRLGKNIYGQAFTWTDIPAIQERIEETLNNASNTTTDLLRNELVHVGLLLSHGGYEKRIQERLAKEIIDIVKAPAGTDATVEAIDTKLRSAALNGYNFSDVLHANIDGETVENTLVARKDYALLSRLKNEYGLKLSQTTEKDCTEFEIRRDLAIAATSQDSNVVVDTFRILSSKAQYYQIAEKPSPIIIEPNYFAQAIMTIARNPDAVNSTKLDNIITVLTLATGHGYRRENILNQSIDGATVATVVSTDLSLLGDLSKRGQELSSDIRRSVREFEIRKNARNVRTIDDLRILLAQTASDNDLVTLDRDPFIQATLYEIESSRDLTKHGVLRNISAILKLANAHGHQHREIINDPAINRAIKTKLLAPEPYKHYDMLIRLQEEPYHLELDEETKKNILCWKIMLKSNAWFSDTSAIIAEFKNISSEVKQLSNPSEVFSKKAFVKIISNLVKLSNTADTIAGFLAIAKEDYMYKGQEIIDGVRKEGVALKFKERQFKLLDNALEKYRKNKGNHESPSSYIMSDAERVPAGITPPPSRGIAS